MERRRTTRPRRPSPSRRRGRAALLALLAPFAVGPALRAAPAAAPALDGPESAAPRSGGRPDRGEPELPAEKLAVDAVLHELAGMAEVTHEERVAKLTALGTAGLPWLFEVLAEVEYFAVDPDGVAHPVRLDQRLGEAIVDALEASPREPLLALLEEVARESPSRGHREAAVRLLGTLGTPAELGLLVRLAAGPAAGDGAGDGATPRVPAELLERAVTLILRRDDTGCKRIGPQLGQTPPELRPALVRGLGRVGTRRALVALASTFTGAADVDVLVLNQIARLSVGTPLPAPPELVRAVHARLDSSSTAVLREAALAAGRLEDSEAIPALIGLLELADPGVHGNAHWALMHISGLRLRDDPERWRAWHEEELAWWREESAALFDVLPVGEPAEVSRAINAIANRKAFRHELAEELTAALNHPDTGIQVQACGALGRLGSLNAVEPLIERLDYTDLDVRESAWQALRTITGLDLPPVPSAWKEAL